MISMQDLSTGTELHQCTSAGIVRVSCRTQHFSDGELVESFVHDRGRQVDARAVTALLEDSVDAKINEDGHSDERQAFLRNQFSQV